MPFRLLTYNIHKGIGGVDRRYDPQRIIEVVAHYQPDIVCLQEVDEHVRRSQFHYQAEMLADAWGMPHRVYQRNVRVRDGHYGNAILSRWPLEMACDVDLTVRFKKRRQALIAHCRIKDEGHQRTVGVASTHLGLAGFERRLQLRKLLACEPMQHFATSTPMVIAGDFNDVYGVLGRMFMTPAGYTSAGLYRTFPAAAPLRPLDRVFYRGPLQPLGTFAGRTALARRASDHLPLIADFQLA